MIVLLGAATAMHGYMAMSLQQLVNDEHSEGGLHLLHVAQGNWVPPVVLLAIVLPLANLPSVAALAKLSTVGVFCFIFLLVFAYISAINAGFDTNDLVGGNTTAFESSRMFRP